MNPLFPDCTIYHMPQRSAPWHEIRKGKLTASAAGEWLAARPECRMTIPEIKAKLDSISCAYNKSDSRDALLMHLQRGCIDPLPVTHLKGTIDARHTAICGILGDISGCEVPDQWEVDPDGLPPKNPALWAVWNGIRMEPESVASFQDWNNCEIKEVGFCLHKSGVAGCSPDGLVCYDPHGFEGKAPLPATHIRYLLDGVLPDQYRSQIHFSMAVTGATGWWFQSYCRGLPALRVFTHRDEYTERVAEGIAEFAECLEAAREEIHSMWEGEK